jgi:hypothetical protein
MKRDLASADIDYTMEPLHNILILHTLEFYPDHSAMCDHLIVTTASLLPLAPLDLWDCLRVFLLTIHQETQR